MTRSAVLSSFELINSFPLDKMAAILAEDIFKWIFLNENDRIPIQISLKYVPRSPIDNKPELVQVMVWCRTGDKPLSEPMLIQFIDAYMRHYWGGDDSNPEDYCSSIYLHMSATQNTIRAIVSHLNAIVEYHLHKGAVLTHASE